MTAWLRTLPGWVKVFGALAAVWLAGWSSAMVAQEYRGTPATLAAHADSLGVHRRAIDDAMERATQRFLYVGCRVDELAAGGPAESRCGVVLDEADRRLLERVRSRR